MNETNLLLKINSVNEDETERMLQYFSKQKVDINFLFTSTVQYQLGFVLEYLQERHNLCIYNDTYSVAIAYDNVQRNAIVINHIIKTNGNPILVEMEIEEPINCFDSKIKAIIRAFEYLKTPF